MFDRQFQALWSPASVELHLEQQMQDRVGDKPSRSLKFHKLIVEKCLLALLHLRHY